MEVSTPSRPFCFTSGRRSPYRFGRGWVGPRSSSERCGEEKKFSSLCRVSKTPARNSVILCDDALEMRFAVLLLRLCVEGHICEGHGDLFQCHCRCGLFNVIRLAVLQSLLSCTKWVMVFLRHAICLPSFWQFVEFYSRRHSQFFFICFLVGIRCKSKYTLNIVL